MRAPYEWPVVGTIIASAFIVRGAIALYFDFRRWQASLDREMDRRARGEFVDEAVRLRLQ